SVQDALLFRFRLIIPAFFSKFVQHNHNSTHLKPMKTISAEETKQAVYSRINFELPLEIWEEIVSAFGTYWNRIGFGNEIDFDTMTKVISQFLKQQNVPITPARLARVLEIMFGYMEVAGGLSFHPTEMEVIDREKMRKRVYEQIDFELSPNVWEEIDEAFFDYWDNVLGVGDLINWDKITSYIVNHLKQKYILIDNNKLTSIVKIIENFMEEEDATEDYNEETFVSMRRMQTAVYSLIDFELPPEIWWEIDYAFTAYWDHAIVAGNTFRWSSIEDFIAGHLKRKHILLDNNKFTRIFKIIRHHMEVNEKVLYEKKKPLSSNASCYNPDRIELYHSESDKSFIKIWASIKDDKLILHTQETGGDVALPIGEHGYQINNIPLASLFKALYINTEDELALLLRKEYNTRDAVNQIVEFLKKHNIAYDRLEHP
ncbi:hypothetical protein, partial [Parabacteroides johnsonii]|uniref:hypothetical protein n=1 Tax=Parabacteroides johnsonii TaxID=387661 RepID=UPI002430B1D7